MTKQFCSLVSWVLVSSAAFCEGRPPVEVMAIRRGGQIKMPCDRRQRPHPVCLQGKVQMDSNAGAGSGGRSKLKTYPVTVTYDLVTRSFSDAFKFGPKASSGHHHGPVPTT